MTISEHAVVIVGGGPTGLMLAGELALAGVDAAIVERRSNQELAGSRAGGLHPRTLEILDQRGVAHRFVSKGVKHQVAPFPGGMQDISDLSTRHSYWLGLWQNEIERILADWVRELGAPVYYGCEAADVRQDEDGADIGLANGQALRAAYIVGCDGGRSLVRKSAGVDFPGWDATVSCLIAEADTAEEPEWGVRYGEKGINALGKLEDGKRLRCVLTETELKHGDAPTIGELREALVSAYGTDFGVHNVTWLSRFTDAARQAEAYRKGRVLLAGDAAHVHSPAGGQGLNIGVRDAANLGWKLAQVVNGVSPESLLDTYHAERHPAGARVLRLTMALNALHRGDEQTNALREMMGEMAQRDDARKWYAARLSGLDIRYDLGEGHELLGRRMPDLDVDGAGGPARVYSLMHDARPLLLNFGAPGDLDIDPWADRVKLIDARYDGDWELPVVGRVTAPGAVLVRPDGYVAWAGDGGAAGLYDVLTTWFGPPHGDDGRVATQRR